MKTALSWNIHKPTRRKTNINANTKTTISQTFTSFFRVITENVESRWCEGGICFLLQTWSCCSFGDWGCFDRHLFGAYQIKDSLALSTTRCIRISRYDPDYDVYCETPPNLLHETGLWADVTRGMRYLSESPSGGGEKWRQREAGAVFCMGCVGRVVGGGSPLPN